MPASASTLTSVVQIATTMETCYQQRKELYGFYPGTDFYLRILRKAMDRHGKGVLETTLDMMRMAEGLVDQGNIVHSFCAAAYYLLEVEPKEHAA